VFSLPSEHTRANCQSTTPACIRRTSKLCAFPVCLQVAAGTAACHEAAVQAGLILGVHHFLQGPPRGANARTLAPSNRMPRLFLSGCLAVCF
jgi:hypothetical protein